MEKKLAIIIPVYNEEGVIRKVVQEALNRCDTVVCVDDGSTDGSVAQIEKTRAYLVKHPINLGQGAALQTGIEFARLLPVDYFCTYDADGQHSIDDVESMYDVLRKGSYDIILGSRFLGKTISMPASKKVLLKMAVRFSNLTSGLKLTDTHNGLRLFNRKVAEEMQIKVPDMAHASEILEIIAARKYKYIEHPVTITYTDYSRAKGQSMVNALNIIFDTILRKFSK